MLFIFPIGILIALLALQVESWPARLVMGGIVLVLWVLLGTGVAGIVSALLSIAILIYSKMPTISKL